MSVPQVALVNWRDPQHSLAGGSERYAWEFARGLVESGAHVTFVTARDKGQTRSETIDGIEVVRAGGQFTFYMWAAWWLLRNRRRLSAVVDPSCGIPAFSPLFVRRRTPVIMVMHHIHQQQFHTYLPWVVAKFGQWLEGRLMGRVYRRARTLAVSDSTAADMVDVLGWHSRPEVLANGADVGDEPQGEPVPGRVVVLGRLVRHKRVDQVVRAVALLVAQGRDISVDIVGKGPEEPSLRALVGELGLDDRVRIHGFLPESEKIAVVGRAEVHVCASDHEGWGQVVIETAGRGVPTLARDVPGLRDSVVDGETGWLLDDAPDQPLAERLADGLDRALGDLALEPRRRAMRDACRAWALNFSWAHMRGEAARVVAEEIARAGDTRPLSTL